MRWGDVVPAGDDARVPEPLKGLAAARWFARFISDPVSLLQGMHAQGRSLAAVRNVFPSVPPKLHVVALGAEWNRRILSDPDVFRTTGQVLSGPRDSSQRRLRHGLTRTQGARHAAQRAALIPPLQKRRTDGYCPAMVGIVEKHLGQWSPGSVIDLRRESLHLNLKLSGETLFKRDDPRDSLALGEQINEWLTANFHRGVMLGLGLPTPGFRAQLRRAEGVEHAILAMLEEKRAAGAKGDDVVSIMLRAHDEGQPWMTEKDLVGQCAIMFGASYETITSSLAWTLFLLAQHPHVALELVDEIESVLGGAAPSAEAFARMPSLEAALRESMRILPPVPYGVRSVEGGAQLGGYTLDHKDRVIISQLVTHHQPELYSEPERYRPERWSGMHLSSYEYLPFSAGPRACIGASFATLALKVALTMILQRFRLSVVPGTRIDPHVRVTMVSRKPIPVELHPADGRFACAPVSGRIHDLVTLDS
jgi:cytochrome P450